MTDLEEQFVKDKLPFFQKGRFGRPANYPHILDAKQYVFDPTADREALTKFEEHPSPNEEKWLSQHRHSLISEPERFFEKSKAKYNDPRVCWQILDAVCKSKPNTYIRPSNMAFFLDQTQGQWLWGSGVIGRLLGGLKDLAVLNYGSGRSDGKSWEEKDKWLPFAGNRDGKGAYFILDPKGGNEGRIWAMTIRGEMKMIAAAQQRADQRGDDRAMFATGYSGFEALVKWLPGIGTIRSKEGYQAQTLDIGDPALDTNELIPSPVDYTKHVLGMEDRGLHDGPRARSADGSGVILGRDG